MKYQILERDSIQGLVDAVTSFISQGWKPIGGVSLGEPYGKYVISYNYLQAMVKE